MSLPNNLPGPPGEFRGNHRRAKGGSPGLAREKVAGADLSGARRLLCVRTMASLRQFGTGRIREGG